MRWPYWVLGLVGAAAVEAQEQPAPILQAPAPIIIERPATPLRDALGRMLDPPVCCQLTRACSAGSPGASSAEVRSLCFAQNGQPLAGQYCHRDGICRP